MGSQFEDNHLPWQERRGDIEVACHCTHSRRKSRMNVDVQPAFSLCSPGPWPTFRVAFPSSVDPI